MNKQIFQQTGKRIIFALIFISIMNIFSGCNSINCAVNSTLLKHDVKYSSKGTRSESRHGYLILPDSNRLPECFEYISNGSRAYQYIKKVRKWGDSGYVEVNELKVISESNNAVSEEALNQGWYKSNTKYTGTPDNWLYGETASGNYFFNYSKVRNLIESENIKCSGKSKHFLYRKE